MRDEAREQGRSRDSGWKIDRDSGTCELEGLIEESLVGGGDRRDGNNGRRRNVVKLRQYQWVTFFNVGSAGPVRTLALTYVDGHCPPLGGEHDPVGAAVAA